MALSKRNCSKRASTAIFCVVAIAIFFCSNDYNPFTDPANARVYVTSSTFADHDSVALFETGTFRVVVAARQEVDSFVFSALKNRYWSDTVIKKTSSEEILDHGPYLFDVSFFDTGYQMVTQTTFRSNGERLSQKFEFRVYQPLYQKNVSGFFGDTLHLSTSAVPDDTKRDVRYHWDLGGNWNISSISSELEVLIPLFSPSRGNGSLLVSDLSGENESPAVTFSIPMRSIPSNP